jgi:hypothetical protein
MSAGARKIRETQEQNPIQFVAAVEVISSVTATQRGNAGRSAMPKRAETLARMAAESRAVKLARERSRLQFVRKAEGHPSGNAEPRSKFERASMRTTGLIKSDSANTDMWLGKPLENEELSQHSLVSDTPKQVEAAKKWAALKAEMRRDKKEKRHAAANYLQQERQLFFVQPVVRQARLRQRLVDEEYNAAGFVRVRPTTHAKPWNREQRHRLRKKALHRAMMFN